MQILGKRSKILLIVVTIVMLVAVGVSFAMWDTSVVKAISGDLSDYANAKVGDIIEFGRYYQTGNRINNDENAEYEKTPIEWIIVDKDERTGQLTLMSKYILACGSYFGNYYYNEANMIDYHYNKSIAEIAGIPYNQAYVESTARAFLNNLERKDLGGDSYTSEDGYKTSVTPSVTTEKLLTSVGFSNRKYSFSSEFKRPIKNTEYKNRPATRGFYDEAFTNSEKSMIIPKTISGYTGHRWPNNSHDPTNMSYIEGVEDKVWLPSTTELNNFSVNDTWTNPSDEASSSVFEYFKNKSDTALYNALKTTRTPFAIKNSKAMNYSIPIYKYQSTVINEDISITKNSDDWYWTRTPVSIFYYDVRVVFNSGSFNNSYTCTSVGGVRPCVILKY